MAQIHVHAFDVDGVLAQQNQCRDPYKANVINPQGTLNEPYLGEFLAKASLLLHYIDQQTGIDPPGRIILKSFSARQSWCLDYGNAEKNNTHLSPALFLTLEQRLKDKMQPIPVELNKLLLADIHRKEKSRHTFAEIQNLSQTLQAGVDQKEIGKSLPQAYFDETKALLAYFIAHQIAAQHPKDDITLYVYDDRFDILISLHEFYATNRNLLPKNVKLKLHNCICPSDQNVTTISQTIPRTMVGISNSDPAAPVEIQLTTIEGRGPIDYDYATGTKELAETAYPQEMLIRGGSNATNMFVAEEYTKNPDYLDNFYEKRHQRLRFRGRFLAPLWEHSIQALFTSATIATCCYYLLMLVVAVSVLPYVPLIASFVALLALIFPHPAAAITDKLVASNLRSALAMAAMLIFAVAAATMLLWAPIWATLLVTAVISYFIVIPALSAAFHYIWVDRELGRNLSVRSTGGDALALNDAQAPRPVNEPAALVNSSVAAPGPTLLVSAGDSKGVVPANTDDPGSTSAIELSQIPKRPAAPAPIPLVRIDDDSKRMAGAKHKSRTPSPPSSGRAKSTSYIFKDNPLPVEDISMANAHPFAAPVVTIAPGFAAS